MEAMYYCLWTHRQKTLDRKGFMCIKGQLSRWIEDVPWTGLEHFERNEELPFLASVLSHKVSQPPSVLVPEICRIKSLVTQRNFTQDPEGSLPASCFLLNLNHFTLNNGT